MTCHKIAYLSRADATRAAQRIPGGQRVYSCRVCDQWHTSSKSERAVKLTRKAWRDASVTRPVDP